MIIVADTSPLISLAVIDKLELLDKLFGKVCIPPAVWQEILLYTKKLGLSNLTKYAQKVRNVESQNELLPFMDKGEAEAVLLCREINADFLLIDDKRARAIAEVLGISCVGTLAVLIKAKKTKLLSELRPLFLQLSVQKRFFARNLLNDVLLANKEKMI